MNDIAPRVLIVEDEWILAEALKDDMTAVGCEVVGPVGTVNQALALLQAEEVTAAILDVSLANASKSFPVARALHARNIPFCFMSGYVREQLPEEFHDTPLFMKPCDGRHLRNHIETLLSKPFG